MCTKVQWRVGTARGHLGEQERLRELGRCFGRLGIPNCSYNQWGNTVLLSWTHLSSGEVAWMRKYEVHCPMLLGSRGGGAQVWNPVCKLHELIDAWLWSTAS